MWQETLTVNLTAPFLLIRSALPHLKATRGSIVNIGSIEGLGANPLHAAYCASKAGLHGLTRAVAVDHGKDGVRCNTVAPSWIETELNAAFVAQRSDPARFQEGLAGSIPWATQDNWRRSPRWWPFWRQATAALSPGRSILSMGGA